MIQAHAVKELLNRAIQSRRCAIIHLLGNHITAHTEHWGCNISEKIQRDPKFSVTQSEGNNGSGFLHSTKNL